MRAVKLGRRGLPQMIALDLLIFLGVGFLIWLVIKVVKWWYK